MKTNETVKTNETGKGSIARIVWIVVIVVSAGAVILFSYRHKSDSAAGVGARAGAAIDNAANATMDAAGAAVDATKEATGRAVEKTGEVLGNAGDAVEQTGSDMQK